MYILIDNPNHANAVTPQPPANGCGISMGGCVDPVLPAVLPQSTHEVNGTTAKRLIANEEPPVPGQGGFARHARLVANERVVKIE
jgi:hypothetical protein